MTRHQLEALETLVRSLHRELRSELDCDENEEDPVDAHESEVAIAGQLLMDLRRDGLTVYKTRTRKRR